MNSGKIVAGGWTGRVEKSKVLQEVLADLKWRMKVIDHDLVDHDLVVQDPAPACLAGRLCHPSGPSCDAFRELFGLVYSGINSCSNPIPTCLFREFKFAESSLHQVCQQWASWDCPRLWRQLLRRENSRVNVREEKIERKVEKFDEEVDEDDQRLKIEVKRLWHLRSAWKRAECDTTRVQVSPAVGGVAFKDASSSCKIKPTKLVFP